jgi:hypothetical protein
MAHTEDICPEIERSSCRVLGETFTFEVQSASIPADRPDHTILEIAVFRRTLSGPAPAAMVRVTAPLGERDRIPALLLKALEEWLLSTTDFVQVH